MNPCGLSFMGCVMLSIACRCLLYAQETVTFISQDIYGKREIIRVYYTNELISNRTMSYPGQLPGRINLPKDPPTENVYNDTQFSRFTRASDLFDVYSYPARAIVKLGNCKTDSRIKAQNTCNGTLVGDRFVLTSAHCVAGYNYSGEMDIRVGFEVSVAPLNGYCNPNIPSTSVIKTYLINEYLDTINYVHGRRFPDNLIMTDIALLELREPIGNLAGWLGIGYNNDFSSYLKDVIHKFAIPGSSQDWPMQSPGNPSLFYNGDTLYYNYGLINTAAEYWLSVRKSYWGGWSSVDDGAPGQSGSPFFIEGKDGSFVIHGTQTFQSDLSHAKLRDKFFYGFKHIMETGGGKNHLSVDFYPNPFSDHLRFNLNEGLLPLDVQIMSMTGNLIEVVKIDKANTLLTLNHLNRGIYLMKVVSGQSNNTIKLVKE